MKKYIPLTLVAVGTLVSATALAQATTTAAPAPQTRGERAPREPLTRDAASTRATEAFARMDANNDGQLTDADREARHAERSAERFAALDTNSDGSISREEFSARPEQPQVAANGESRREGRGRGHRGGMMGGRDAMRTADADNNGAITQGEFTNAMLARFDAADADRNGTLTAEERRAARPERGDRRGGHLRGPAPAQSAEG